MESALPGALDGYFHKQTGPCKQIGYAARLPSAPSCRLITTCSVSVRPWSSSVGLHISATAHAASFHWRCRLIPPRSRRRLPGRRHRRRACAGTSIRPRPNGQIPAMARSRVVLPAPDGPAMATRSPAITVALAAMISRRPAVPIRGKLHYSPLSTVPPVVVAASAGSSKTRATRLDHAGSCAASAG